ncbi:MAG: HypC/HybG/HupF family hydrogenase formation chaperone [Pseudomonadales bacterium]|nr:HypC/HybG/HupF family hydrogenase formation chaperone [Pseudomonadales bacterium]
MCLAIPGEIISIKGDDALSRSGQVRFGDVMREICLAFVPDAVEGDYVLIHAGIAISVLDEDAAQATFRALEQIE